MNAEFEHPEMLRQPPMSTDAEQSVIGGLLLAPETLAKLADWLAEEDFYRRDHRLIYRGIVRLSEQGKPIDWVTLGEWLEANNLLDQVGGTSYLVDLAGNTPSAANIVGYAEIVVEMSRHRQAIEIGMKLANDGFDRRKSAVDLAAAAQGALANLSPVRHTGLQASTAGVQRWWDDLLTRVDRPGLIGMPTPWLELNKATKGLRPGRLYILAGRPGMGKSIIGGQLAAFTALRGVRTALFSLEMSEEEIHQRNIAAFAGVPHDFLDSPTGESHYWERLNPAIAALKRAPLLVDDSAGLTAGATAARAERAHLQAPLGLIVVDHLHEMHVDPKDRASSLGDACKRLKACGKRLGVPVVLLAQLNRDSAKDGGKRPTMTDLRGSGDIEQVADAIFFLHREDYYRKDTHLRDVIELEIAKGRNMRPGRVVYLHNRYEQMRADDWEGPLPEDPGPTPKTPPVAGFGRNQPDHKAAAAADDRIRDVTGNDR